MGVRVCGGNGVCNGVWVCLQEMMIITKYHPPPSDLGTNISSRIDAISLCPLHVSNITVDKSITGNKITRNVGAITYKTHIIKGYTIKGDVDILIILLSRDSICVSVLIIDILLSVSALEINYGPLWERKFIVRGYVRLFMMANVFTYNRIQISVKPPYP